MTSANSEAEPFIYASPNFEISAFYIWQQVAEKARDSQICFWLSLLQNSAQSSPGSRDLSLVALVRDSFKLPV